MRELREPVHESPGEAEATEHAPAEHVASSERFVAGVIPPVHAGSERPPPPTASELAYEQDENVAELKTKIGGLVAKKFGGDYKAAFTAYDTDHDGAIDKSELLALLKDSSVGNSLTRSTWATKIIERLDKTPDAKIQWEEFETVFTSIV